MKINKKAFTILEMSIVVICISIFLGITVKITYFVDISKELSTKLKLKKINLALENYVRIHGYLPCPSNIKLKVTDPNFGLELSTDDSECKTTNGLFEYKNIYVGGIPINALGLNHNDAVDSWGNKIVYSVSSNIVKNYIDTNTNLCVTFTGTNNKYSKIENVYYAIISSGKNKFGAIPASGTSNIKMGEVLSHQQEAVNIFSQSEFLGGVFNCLAGFSKNNKNFDDILYFGVYNEQLIKKINKK